jgi:hypothetical protein
MFRFQQINGLSIGLEYADIPEVGFVINADLGFVRVTWFRDVWDDGTDDEDDEWY